MTNNIRFLIPKSPQPELPLFVFLPGMDGTGELLRSQISLGLIEAFDIRCLAIPPDDLSKWDLLTNKVVALIQAEVCGNRRPVYLCGESFGGCLALKVVIQAPSLIDKLILVNPASSFSQRPWLQWGSHLTGWLPDPLYAVSVVGFLPFLASLGRISRPLVEDLLAAMQFVTQPTSNWRVGLLREFEISKTQLSQISQPVLIIASAGDLLLPSVNEAKRLTHYIPSAKRVVLPHSGHACLLETDVNLYAILKDQEFLPSCEVVGLAV